MPLMLPSVELTMLAWSVALLFALIVVAATLGATQYSILELLGNRDNLEPPGVLVARAKRAVANHIEGLVLFAPLVLMLEDLGQSSNVTVLGAQLFFYGRVAHAICYLVGIPVLRTLAWLAGIAGTGMIFLALFKLI